VEPITDEAFDFAIENGTLVAGAGRSIGNVYVRAETIAAVGPDHLPARERFDASGLLVMPGMVDTHVHLMDPGDPTREDFPSGTAAAARSGVTTIVEHTHAAPIRGVAGLDAKRHYLASRSRVDFALAAHAWPDRLDDVADLWQAGVAFFKVFTCSTHGIPGFDAAHLTGLFKRVAEVGAVCLVHAEDEDITGQNEQRLRSEGRMDGGVIPEWRARDAETTALRTATTISEATGARMIAAHLSHPAAVRIVHDAGARGVPILGETCPQYLTLLEDEVLAHGAFRKFTPPARARDEADLAAMWQELEEGRVNHVSTDHAPSTEAQKRNGSIWDVHFGLPGLDTTMGVLLDGAAAGRLSYERLVQVYSEAPARAYGLAPQKGSLAVGADADIIVVDPAATWVVERQGLHSRAGWSPYEGRTLQGRTVRTYLRGVLVASDDHLATPGIGRFVPGAGTTTTASP
jgi:dihydroorotase (multifunctional complex type)